MRPHLLMQPSEFSAVYDQHLDRVYGFFAYRLQSRGDIEDLTQLAFERALRAWDRYDPQRAGVATWLLAIARNLLIDHYRASRAARDRSLDESDAGMERFLRVWDEPDLGLDPGIERALGALGARERELIALRFGAELSGPEIATITGLSLANVQQILSRALRRMRDSLAAPAALVA